MKALGVLLVVFLCVGCAAGSHRITVEGLGAVEQYLPSPGYEVDGSLRCADLRRQGCMITC